MTQSPLGTPQFSSATTIAVEIVTSHLDLERLVPAWRSLEREAPGATLFQSIGWARAVFDFEAATGNERFRPMIAVARTADDLLAILPLELVAQGGGKILAPLGQAYQQYSDILLAAGVDGREVVARIIAELRAATGADAVHLRKVRADSRLAGALPASALRGGEPMAAPFIDMTAHADFSAYLQTIRAKTRKNIRSGRNRLERTGTLTHRLGATPEERAAVMARTLSGRAQRLKEQGLTSRAFHDDNFVDFCLSFARRDDADANVVTSSLLHEGQPISENWGFVHNRRLYFFVTTRDFGMTDESPGKIHMQDAIAAWFGLGLDAADLMVPAMPYKSTWASGEVAVSDFIVPLSWAGALRARFWDGWLRPTAKSIILALPPRLRAALLGIKR